jgi:hypothetical protein
MTGSPGPGKVLLKDGSFVYFSHHLFHRRTHSPSPDWGYCVQLNSFNFKNKMKTMKIVSYFICGIGIFGSFLNFSDGDVSGGVLGLALFGFFLALTANIKLDVDAKN